MARIVGGIGCSHAPSIAHSYDKKLQKDPMWAPLYDGWEPAKEWLTRLKPDLMVVVHHRCAMFPAGPYRSPTKRAATLEKCCSGLNDVQAVEARRGAGEQICLVSCRSAAREPLEGIEQNRIAARTLVDREIAFEHAAVRTEGLDRGFDIRAPGVGQFAR